MSVYWLTGSAHSSVFWDFLPLQEEAFLTGRINSEEEAVHPLCQVGSFPGPQRKRRALRVWYTVSYNSLKVV